MSEKCRVVVHDGTVVSYEADSLAVKDGHLFVVSDGEHVGIHAPGWHWARTEDSSDAERTGSQREAPAA